MYLGSKSTFNASKNAVSLLAYKTDGQTSPPASISLFYQQPGSCQRVG